MIVKIFEFVPGSRAAYLIIGASAKYSRLLYWSVVFETCTSTGQNQLLHGDVRTGRLGCFTVGGWGVRLVGEL
jgi:hypothetical protein